MDKCHLTCLILCFDLLTSFFLLLLCFLVQQAQFRALLSPAGKQKQQGIQSLQAEMSVYLHIERGSEIHNQKWSLETHRQMHGNGRREHVLRAVHFFSDHSGRILKTGGTPPPSQDTATLLLMNDQESPLGGACDIWSLILLQNAEFKRCCC